MANTRKADESLRAALDLAASWKQLDGKLAAGGITATLAERKAMDDAVRRVMAALGLSM